jgi:Holliday junction resolvasome RuvABC endonuclease subunit
MLILGIDPGVRLSGWALLEREGARPARWIDGGHAPAEEILATQVERASLVAIEWLANGLFERKRHDALIGVARTEGALETILRRLGVEVITLSAGQWRSDVVGRASPSDEEIAERLQLLVTGIPSPPVITKEALNHALDALGVAFAAAHRPGKQLALLGRKRT